MKIEKTIRNNGITVCLCREEGKSTTTAILMRKELLLTKGFGKQLPYFFR